MTTWQDQQRTSRRALRESERAHAQATMSDAIDEDTKDPGFDQQIWQDQPVSLPLDHSDHAAPTSSEGELRRPRGSGSTRPAADPAPSESPAYRIRDFSPETRGSSFSSTQSAPWTPPSPGSEDLSYKTSVEAGRAAQKSYSTPVSAPPVVVTPDDVPVALVPVALVPGVPVAGVPVAAEHPVVDNPIEHTLTRRELRELRNAAARQDSSQVTPDVAASEEAESQPVVPEFVGPALVTQLPVATVEDEPQMVEPVLAEPVLAELVEDEPHDSAPPTSSTSVARLITPPSSAPLSQQEELAAAMAEFDKLFRKEQEVPPLVEPVAEQWPEVTEVAAPPAPEELPVIDALPVDDAPLAQPAPSFDWGIPAAEAIAPLREVVTAPEVYSASSGNWPTPREERPEPSGTPHRRDISSIDAITTSALILPSFSASAPITGPVSGTGEILMTGSINLPRSLGSTGLHPSRYDRADLDDIIDAGDRENLSPESAPVRAVSAISTYTSSQGLINARRPKGGNLPMILSITAGVMMVGVVVLVVVGMVFKIF